MHRLVIALTALLTLTGAVVVAAYLLLFTAQADRLARAVPADTAVYATVYLQPSTGQKMNLAQLLGRVPGFADQASLDQKIHDITARFLRQAGIDYESDVRPWLGEQLSVAVQPEGIDPAQAQVLVVIATADPEAARVALARMAPGTTGSHQGVDVTSSDEATWALLDELVLIGTTAAAVERGIDAGSDRSPSLADAPDFRESMEVIEPDHLAAAFVDLDGVADRTGAGDQLNGYSTAALALVVEPDGLRLAGSAPFNVDQASAPAREAFALSSVPSSLAEWMPEETQAELVVFGLAQSLRAAEEQLGGAPGGRELADALNQMRAILAFGLGVSLDQDLLPLFDREAAIAVTGLDGDAPRGQLLLRPSDPQAAEATLERITGAVRDRGIRVEETEADGHAVTVMQIPQLGSVAYAVRDGVVVAAFGEEDVAAVLAAEANGSTLAETERYRAAWELAGIRGGNELWIDAAALVDAAEDELGLTGEARDILLEVGALAMTAPAGERQTEFHAVLTVR